MKLVPVFVALAALTFLTLPALAAEAPVAAGDALAVGTADVTESTITEPAAVETVATPAVAAENVTFPAVPLFAAEASFRCTPGGGYPPASCTCGGCCEDCRCWNGGTIAKCVPW